jgi:hypothetical protein
MTLQINLGPFPTLVEEDESTYKMKVRLMRRCRTPVQPLMMLSISMSTTLRSRRKLCLNGNGSSG